MRSLNHVLSLKYVLKVIKIEKQTMTYHKKSVVITYRYHMLTKTSYIKIRRLFCVCFTCKASVTESIEEDVLHLHATYLQFMEFELRNVQQGAKITFIVTKYITQHIIELEPINFPLEKPLHISMGWFNFRDRSTMMNKKKVATKMLFVNVVFTSLGIKLVEIGECE